MVHVLAPRLVYAPEFSWPCWRLRAPCVGLDDARHITGKTIAFLLPTIERLVARRGPAGSGVGALVISPTRELASQIGEECEQLITFHKPLLSSLVVVGGTVRTERSVCTRCSRYRCSCAERKDGRGCHREADAVYSRRDAGSAKRPACESRWGSSAVRWAVHSRVR
jgi:hypothetical protein